MGLAKMERMKRKQIGRQAFDVVFWAAAIVIVASCVGLIFNASRTKGIELVYRPPTEIITDSGEVPVIDVDEAKRLFDEGAVFLELVRCPNTCRVTSAAVCRFHWLNAVRLCQI